MRRNQIVNGILLVLSLLLIVGVYTFAHICRGMQGMVAPCETTRTWTVVFGVIIALISLLLLLGKGKSFGLILSIVRLVVSGLVILLPDYLAPVCSMKTMHCYVYTRPFLILVGVLLVGLEIVLLILNRLLTKGEAGDGIS